MNKVVSMFYKFVSLFPFGLGAFWAFCCIVFGGAGRWFGHEPGFYGHPDFVQHLLGGLGCFCLISLVGWILYNRLNCIDALKGNKGVCICLFLATTGLRAFFIVLFCNRLCEYSDFAMSWYRAVGNVSAADYHMFYPAWMNFSLFQRLWFLAFGRYYCVSLLMGVIFNGMTVVMLYYFVLEVFKTKLMAMIAALVYALYPALILYAMVGSPEHMAIAFFVMLAFCYARMMNSRGAKDLIGWASLAGLVFGIGDAVKPFAPIIICAMVISFLVKLVSIAKERRLIMCASVVYVIILRTMIVFGLTSMSEYVFDKELSSVHAVSSYLNAGLNREGEGQFHIGTLSRAWLRDMQSGMSAREADLAMFARVKNSWKNHIDEIPSFVVRKNIWAWQDFNTPFFYFEKCIGLSPNNLCWIQRVVYNAVVYFGATASQIFYFILLIASAVGAYLFSRDKRPVDAAMLFPDLLIAGYLAMVVIGEAQSRYKCLVMPFIIVFFCKSVLIVSSRGAEHED